MFPEGRAVEFLIVAAVALIFVGPKDLPVLLRKLGQFMAKVRGMAAEFRASFDEMARQSELDELRKEVEAMRQGQVADMATSAHAGITSTMDEISQGLTDGIQLHPPMSYQYEAAQAAADAPVPKPPRVRKPAAAKAAPKAKSSTKPAAKAKAASAKPRARKSTGAAS